MVVFVVNRVQNRIDSAVFPLPKGLGNLREAVRWNRGPDRVNLFGGLIPQG